MKLPTFYPHSPPALAGQVEAPQAVPLIQVVRVAEAGPIQDAEFSSKAGVRVRAHWRASPRRRTITRILSKARTAILIMTAMLAAFGAGYAYRAHMERTDHHGARR